MRVMNTMAMTMAIMTLMVQINAFGTFKQVSQQPCSSFASVKGSCLHKMVSFDNLPKIFSDNSSSESESSSTTTQPPPSQQTTNPEPTDPDSLLRRAKEVLASSMAITDPSLLSEDFVWIGPDVFVEGSLGKSEYLAAGQFFYLDGAFPDLNYRAHDFRINNDDPLTVRFTARTVGTMRGELRLRNEILRPNGKQMVCPPEAISMTFDGVTGRLSKLCTGFTMDRLVGNTGGLCAVKAAATVAGAPPSEWEIYPPTTVLRRFFARPTKSRDEPDVFLAPFPETVMIQLAKGVLAAGNGLEDPSLLGEDFAFSGPSVGPLDKRAFLEEFGRVNVKAAFPDFEENYSNFRVDPYDPYRVWFDSKMKGTWTRPLEGKEPNGNVFMSPVESNSLTFDDDGFCTRLTAGYVMDPSDSNTGGLGGIFGIYYAIGNAQLPLSTRSLPQIFARAQTAAFSIFTGADVDDFAKEPINLLATVAAQSQVFTPQPPSDEVEDDSDDSVSDKFSSLFARSDSEEEVEDDSADSVSDKFSSLFARNDSDDDAETNQNSSAAAAKEERAQQRIQQQEEFAAKRKAQTEMAAQARADAAEKRQAETAAAAKGKAANANANKKKESSSNAGGGEPKKNKMAMMMGKKEKVETEPKQQPKKNKMKMMMGKKEKVETETKQQLGKKKTTKTQQLAPAGVPELKRWKKNKDDSITGFITGSSAFSIGEKVTTSPIAKGKIESGNVIRTESGSKYFLN